MRGLLFLALTATGLIFFLQNRQPVTLFFLGTSQQSALASLTLPLGLWVVIFSALGIVTSLILSGLSRIGLPQRRPTGQPGQPAPPRPTPPPPPRYQPPTPEPVINQNEWDWDNPIPELADWDEKPASGVGMPQQSRSPRDRHPPTRPDIPESIAAPNANGVPPGPSPAEPKIKPEPDPRRQEPLPDLRQFEVPQTPTETKRQGTIYSQQYRPVRSPAAKASPAEATRSKPQPIYDASYRVINPASSPSSVNPEQQEDLEDDEEWI
ncbi:MAG: hypothetical protein RLZZ568_419 [Cyanobacteriota bacterium]